MCYDKDENLHLNYSTKVRQPATKNFMFSRLPKNKTREPDSLEKAYSYASFLLGRKFYSQGELTQKLKNKGFNAAAIAQTLARLTEFGFLNDQRLTENFITNLIAYKTYGYYLIKQKLLAKRLPKDICEPLLSQYLDIETETKIARRWLNKQAINKSAKADFAQKTKLAARLQSRGFRMDVINRVLLI